MGINRTSIVGHHTGGVIAVEVAATHPERVDKLVLSSTPYVDAEDRNDERHGLQSMRFNSKKMDPT
jgi:pimeloyl-ACP methyl ester carboxylesterase